MFCNLSWVWNNSVNFSWRKRKVVTVVLSISLWGGIFLLLFVQKKVPIYRRIHRKLWRLGIIDEIYGHTKKRGIKCNALSMKRILWWYGKIIIEWFLNEFFSFIVWWNNIKWILSFNILRLKLKYILIELNVSDHFLFLFF